MKRSLLASKFNQILGDPYIILLHDVPALNISKSAVLGSKPANNENDFDLGFGIESPEHYYKDSCILNIQINKFLTPGIETINTYYLLTKDIFRYM